VLDVGCGSGILSIACARLGATRALGLDIEEEALRIAPENAAANGVAQICRFERTAVADVAGTFDLVLANILAPVLRELRPVLCARARGGMLVLSGFKEKNRDELVASYEAEGLRLKTELERDGWHTVLLRAAEVSR
jgi:ribosomal protein L11 methyltransferase